MAQAPARALDIGGDGAFLAACYPQARVLAVDFAAAALDAARPAVCADAEALPLAAQSVQLAWSTFCAEWTDYRLFFGEAGRVLAEGGLLAFATLGAGSLGEARAVFGDVPRVHGFADMHDLGDALMQAGFAEPLMESERLVLTYASAEDALTDARRQGAANALRGRRPLTRARWRRALADYQARYADASGRVPAGYEVVYATAWRAAPRAAAGESPLRFLRGIT